MKYSDLQSLMAKYGISPKKALGQNFLMDENILKKIAEAANIKKGENILEIGPGLGFLTKFLAEKKAKITALELDSRLTELLKNEYKDVEILNTDALKYEPTELNYKIVANIPYYITSPLISHYLEAKNKPSQMILLIQKEVAEKICAREGSLNVLAIHIQIYGKPEVIAKVPANCFYPAPKVDSAIIKIDIFKKSLVENPEKFLKVVHAGFAHKRKTIYNSLIRKFSHLQHEQVKEALKKCSIDEKRRGQTLSINEWECLTKIMP
ncbi:ribosomal RNA small subunit methyltransferase A [Candidatus Peregrinibacteria bacterium]|nr:ribosomal RNA small subunit methyltransferase A [Candidatus Peregrinibacteria bacterium]